MFQTASPAHSARLARTFQDEVVGALAGVAFTFGLFFAVAYVQRLGSPVPVDDIEDLHGIAVPLDPPPPPPKIVETQPEPETPLPLTGIEIAASDSPVSISVVPPDLEKIIPSTATEVHGRIQALPDITEFKPKSNIEVDTNHIYQETEIDQRPHSIVRTAPHIPAEVSGNASAMRVLLLLLIDQRGKVESARIVQTSGNPQFDEIVSENVKNQWLFSPGMRRGKKVRVLAQQAFRIVFKNGDSSPFAVGP